MNRLKLILRIGGVLMAAIGTFFLPLPIMPGVNPKRDMSQFFDIVDTGAFSQWAFVLIPLGLIALVLYFLVPGDADTL